MAGLIVRIELCRSKDKAQGHPYEGQIMIIMLIQNYTGVVNKMVWRKE